MLSTSQVARPGGTRGLHGLGAAKDDNNNNNNNSSYNNTDNNKYINK